MGRLLAPDSIAYLGIMTLLTSWWAMLAPAALLAAAPLLVFNVLSVHPPQADFTYQYSVAVAPLVFFAGLLGLRWVGERPWMRRRGGGRARVHLLLALTWALPLAMVGLSFHPIPIYAQEGAFDSGVRPEVLREVAELVPVGSSVAISNDLAPHFLHGRNLREFRYFLANIGQAEPPGRAPFAPDYLVLNLPGEARTVGAASTEAVLGELPRLTDGRPYTLVYERDGVAVWRGIQP